MSKFPHSLLALTDSQLELLMALARPLPVSDCDRFLTAAARDLKDVPGDRLFRRRLIEIQRKFLRSAHD